VARPTKYTAKMGDEICKRLAEGESLNRICKDEHIADKSNVFRWLLATDNKLYNTFRDNYAQAREIQYQCMADDIIDIADDGRNDWMEKEDPTNEGYDFNGEALGRSRLRVDTRKWFMSKVLPKFKDKPEEVQRPTEPINVTFRMPTQEEIKAAKGDD
jgi:hypothetical protein